MHKKDDNNLGEIDYIKKIIDKYDYISFDIFDTLIVRPFAYPWDLFLFIEKFYKVEDYAYHRRIAEYNARRFSLEEEVTIDEIYDYIDDKYKKYEKIEKSLEIQLSFANERIKKLYDYALQKGKQIIITSDMYLDSDTIDKILKKSKYNNYKLFLSSKEKFSKSTGNLFYKIFKDLKIDCSQIIHIGDNDYSDVAVPKKMGIKSIKITKNIDALLSKFPLQKSYYNAFNFDVNASIFLGLNSYLYSNFKDRDFWFIFGFMYAGPLISAYAEWLKVNIENRGYTDVWFLARDGYNLIRAFDYITKNKYNTSYIYYNRSIKLMADLDFYQHSTYSEIYNSSLNAILEFYNKKLKLFNKNFENFSITEKIEMISQNRHLFDKYSRKLKNDLIKYLNQNTHGGKIALVDGQTAKFTAQIGLSSCLPNKNIDGFYWLVEFLPYKFSQIPFKNLRYKNFCEDKNLTLYNWHLLETILSSPEHSIEAFEDGRPIYKQDKNDSYRSSIYNSLSDGSFEFMKLFHDIFKNTGYLVKYLSVSNYINDFSYNSPKHMLYCNYFKKMSIQESFGKRRVSIINTEKKLFINIPQLKQRIKIRIYKINDFSKKICGKKIFYKKHTNNSISYKFLCFTIIKKENING